MASFFFSAVEFLLRAFSHSIPIHCSTYPYAFILLLVRLMPVSLCLQPQHSHTLQYIPLFRPATLGLMVKAFDCEPQSPKFESNLLLQAVFS